MNEIAANLVVLFATVCLIAAIFWWTKRRQANQLLGLWQMAAERGWELMPVREPLAWGFRVTGPGWVLEVISRSAAVESGPGSSEIAESTCWQAQSAGGPIIIGPRLLPGDADSSVSAWMHQQVVGRILGAAAAGLHEIAAGSPALRQQYSLWAGDAADLEALLSQAVESALLHWQGKKPVINRAQGMLQIAISGVRYEKAAQMDALVHLGEALLPKR